MNTISPDPGDSWIPFLRYFNRIVPNDHEYVETLRKQTKLSTYYRFGMITLFVFVIIGITIGLEMIRKSLVESLLICVPNPNNPNLIVFNIQMAQSTLFFAILFGFKFGLIIEQCVMHIIKLIYFKDRTSELMMKYHDELQEIYQKHPELKEKIILDHQAC